MKAAVVYWSGTGNTAAMADLVLKGMQSAARRLLGLMRDHPGFAENMGIYQ